MVLFRVQTKSYGFTLVLLRVHRQSGCGTLFFLGSKETPLLFIEVLLRVHIKSIGFTFVLLRVQRKSFGFTKVLLRAKRKNTGVPRSGSKEKAMV